MFGILSFLFFCSLTREESNAMLTQFFPAFLFFFYFYPPLPSSGVMVANFTNPIWVVKTRMQLQNSSIHGDSPVSMRFKNSFHCFRVILREEGIFGLYKGLTASYFGMLPSSPVVDRARAPAAGHCDLESVSLKKE
jgi:hypothetical protein